MLGVRGSGKGGVFFAKDTILSYQPLSADDKFGQLSNGGLRTNHNCS